MKKLVVLSLVLFFSVNVFCQNTKKVELMEYIKEIQVWQKQENKMSWVFWIPNSYWRLALEDSPQVTPEVISQIEAAFADYVFVCALDLNILSDGGMRYKEELDMRKDIVIKDCEGNEYRPLKEKDLTPLALEFSKLVRPMFAQMLGQMGQGMHFYFFDVKNEKGENLLNEYEQGEFLVEHSGKSFEFQLPLVCLMPAKYCPVDSAEMKGNWNFCPIHGVKL